MIDLGFVEHVRKLQLKKRVKLQFFVFVICFIIYYALNVYLFKGELPAYTLAIFATYVCVIDFFVSEIVK